MGVEKGMCAAKNVCVGTGVLDGPKCIPLRRAGVGPPYKTYPNAP